MNHRLVRLLSLLCALLLLTSCGTKVEDKKSDVVVETIEFSQLMEDLENGAKAELNVGKATAVCGRIDYIESDYCRISLIYPLGKIADVILPIEVLAELKKEQFIFVSATVENVGCHNATGSSYTYTFKADKLEDLSLMDEYIKESISSTYYPLMTEELDEIFSVKLLASYAESRGDVFLIKDDTELKNYLIGKWEYDTSRYESNDDVEFREDGKYHWEYLGYTVLGWHDDEQTSDWTVSNGFLDSFIGYDPQKVFALTSSVFIIQDAFFTKVG